MVQTPYENKNQHSHQKPSNKQKKENRLQEMWDSACAYTKEMNREPVIYILLVIGVILLPFHLAFAQLFIGLAAGATFGPELVEQTYKIRATIEKQGITRTAVAVLTLLALVIAVPVFFFGLLIAVAVGLALSKID